MSNRRRPRNTFAATLDQLAGQRVPGGCSDCDAYQVTTREAEGLYRVNVHHDDTCPFYRGLLG